MSQPQPNNNPTSTYVDINIDQNNGRQNANEFVGPKKGNFLYDKCYICISIFKWFPVLFILAITIWSYYAYVLQLCIFTIESLPVKILYILIFNVLYGMTLWSYYQTVFTTSKIAPAAFRLTNADYERIIRETTDESRNQILFEISKERQLPLACRTYSGAVRFCSKCNLIKPDRAHHCSVCNNCILKMDHHCPWVNNCVSFSNYKFFILFLMYSFLMCLFGAITSFPYFLEFWSNQMPTLGKFNILFLFFVSIMFSISLFSLFSYHIYLVLRNLTTLENFRSPLFSYGPNKNAFNLGKLNNLKEVFGQNKILWILPVYTTLGTGVFFKNIYLFSSDEDADYDNQPLLANQDDDNDENILFSYKGESNVNLASYCAAVVRPVKLGLSNQNDEITTQQSNRSNNVEKTPDKKNSLNCFRSFCCSFGGKAKKESKIDVNLDLFDTQKMNNPFKQGASESKSSSISTLSAMDLKPIKSLSSNATGSGRTKVDLKPGHSLMDWVRLTGSGKDFTCNSFGARRVTGAELAQHNKREDAWTSIQGNVFNITEYLDFHPGGVDELMRAAGKESTQLFKQIHAWVNWSSLLGKCKVGHLIQGDDVQFAVLDKKAAVVEVKKAETVESKAEVKKSETVESIPFNDEVFEKNFVVLTETDSLYDMNLKDRRFSIDDPVINLNEYQTIDNKLQLAQWYETMDEFFLHFKFEKANVKEEDLMIDLTEPEKIKLKIYISEKVFYLFECRLLGAVKREVVLHMEDKKSVIIPVEKLISELWAGRLHSDRYRFELTNQNPLNTFFRKVKLVEKKSLTHDVYSFSFQVPDGLYLPVKYGNHVAFRMKIDNEPEPVFRYYTLVPHWFLDSEDDNEDHFETKNIFYFFIKIYKDGQFTPKLGELKIGDPIEMSDAFSIEFDLMKMFSDQTKKTIFLLAAGTGITPMLSVLFLNKLVAQKDPKIQDQREIKLIFCNKTEKDIILRKQFEKMAERKDLGFKFTFINVLSRASPEWSGLKGRMSKKLVEELMKFDQNEFLFLCGPDEFNLSVLNILDSLFSLNEHSYFIFSS